MHEQLVATSTARELLNELRPTASHWGDNPRGWLFRGQSDSSKSLMPNAFRDEAWKPFRQPGLPQHEPSRHYPEQKDRQAIEEFSLLRRFFWAVDRAGLAVPEHLHARALLNQYPYPGFSHTPGQVPQPPNAFGEPAIQALMALAQHHGIPTRLLDVTRSSINAGYFAASGAARKHTESRSGTLAVWAFPISFMGFASTLIQHGAPIDLRMVTTATAPNANLRAQRGLFLLWWHTATGTPILDLPSVIETLANYVCARCPGSPPATFLKFQLPWSESPELCRLLADEGATAAQLFPSYDGVAQSLREEATWDRMAGDFGSVRDGLV